MSDDRKRWRETGMIGATDDAKWLWNGRDQPPPLGNLAAQARSKGFTAATHRVGNDQYPITVRPDPRLPQWWIVLDTYVKEPNLPNRAGYQAVSEARASIRLDGQTITEDEWDERPKIVAGDKLECHRTYQFDHKEDGVMYFRET